MKLSAITIGPRSRRTLTGIDSLAASIEKVGLIHPPAVREVDGQFVLVAGHRRIEAMRSLGWMTTSPPRSRPPSPHVVHPQPCSAAADYRVDLYPAPGRPAPISPQPCCVSLSEVRSASRSFPSFMSRPLPASTLFGFT